MPRWLGPVARARRDLGRVVSAAGVAAIASILVAGFAAGALERGAVIALWTVLAPIFALAALPMMRTALAERAPAVVLVGALGAAPAIFLGAMMSSSQPIALGGWRCGTGDIAIVCVVPFVGVIVALMTGGDAWRARRAWAPRAVPLAAIVAASIASVLIAASSARALRHPGPDAWVASLPIVIEVRHSAHDERSTHRIADGLAIERECSAGYCTVSLRRVALAGPIGEDLTARVPACVRRGEARQLPPAPTEICGVTHDIAVGSSMRVHVDRARDLWLIESNGQTLGFDANLEPRGLTPTEVAGEIAPPRTFVAVAIAGLALALLALLRRIQLAARSRVIASARACTVDEDGIAFDDGELPARGAAVNDAPLGAAVAIAGRAGPAGYRDDGSRAGWHVLAGTKDDLLRVLDGRRATCDAVALTFLVLTSTPLVAAVLDGFVF